MNPRFAPKLFINDPLSLQASVLDIAERAESLEIALYGHGVLPPEHIQERIIKIPFKLIHLWQAKIYLMEPDILNNGFSDSLLHEINQGKELEVYRFVIHRQLVNVHDNSNPAELAKKLIPLHDFALKHNIRFYIENVYESTAFFRDLFKLIKEYKLYRFGFCLDAGHAKAYSKEDLSDWFQLVKQFKLMHVPMHFHIHLNDGVTDQHLSISQAHASGLLYLPNYTRQGSFLTWLDDLTYIVNNAMFCLEHPAIEANAAFGFLSFLQEDGYLQNKINRPTYG